ncbi:glutathione S-transferase, putative [Trichosporon asahii var. asahii CBS 2479]|uniref:glutathione transferase n=1 Tax=Trichosporon asahii var. asahii (strain ATCC 90039 / CBS 2479 / JCM 2466 / KCTC 7840 / NBRC 103889/ NCYC 2677 / UAMH 7654) TaxID=1186058 RepID=J6EQ11_TRIAS|nr:glutathione S-transferase, putative [Trichosporon asahii var. asahii CBS 2479]EJT46524.1 glutathione S-transferase, putative [Trichosporon asahii var. asahii CBS 2479]
MPAQFALHGNVVSTVTFGQSRRGHALGAHDAYSSQKRASSIGARFRGRFDPPANADTSIPWPNCSSSPYTVEDSLADTQSVNTARICIAEAQLENEVEFVNHDFKLVWSEEWRKHQPFNQMPYMLNKDTGYTIYESRAIAKYLMAKYKKTDLMPPMSETEKYGTFEQASSVEENDFDAHAGQLAAELIWAPVYGKQADPKRVEDLKAKLQKTLEGYERVLTKHTWVAGPEMTIADLFHLPNGTLAVLKDAAPGLTDGTLPHVTAWWAKLSNLPNWKKIEGEALEAMKAMGAHNTENGARIGAPRYISIGSTFQLPRDPRDGLTRINDTAKRLNSISRDCFEYGAYGLRDASQTLTASRLPPALVWFVCQRQREAVPPSMWPVC